MSEFNLHLESKKHKYHGRYVAKRILQESRRERIDGRSEEGKELKALIADLGDRPTKAKMMIAKRLVRAQTLAERLDHHIATLPIVSRRRKQVMPLVLTYMKLLETITHAAALLGVERVESKGQDLAMRLSMRQAQPNANGGTK